MKNEEKIKNKMLELYEENEKDKIQSIKYMPVIEFGSEQTKFKYQEEDIFVVETQVDSEKGEKTVYSIFASDIKIATVEEGKIYFTEEYIQHIKELSTVVYDTLSKEQGQEYEIEEREMSLDVDQDVKLHDGTITTLRKEAEKFEISPEEYLKYFEEAKGNCISDRVENTNIQIKSEKQKEEDLDRGEQLIRAREERKLIQ